MKRKSHQTHNDQKRRKLRSHEHEEKKVLLRKALDEETGIGEDCWVHVMGFCDPRQVILHICLLSKRFLEISKRVQFHRIPGFVFKNADSVRSFGKYWNVSQMKEIALGAPIGNTFRWFFNIAKGLETVDLTPVKSSLSAYTPEMNSISTVKLRFVTQSERDSFLSNSQFKSNHIEILPYYCEECSESMTFPSRVCPCCSSFLCQECWVPINCTQCSNPICVTCTIEYDEGNFCKNCSTCPFCGAHPKCEDCHLLVACEDCASIVPPDQVTKCKGCKHTICVSCGGRSKTCSECRNVECADCDSGKGPYSICKQRSCGEKLCSKCSRTYNGYCENCQYEKNGETVDLADSGDDLADFVDGDLHGEESDRDYVETVDLEESDESEFGEENDSEEEEKVIDLVDELDEAVQDLVSESSEGTE